MYSLILAMNLVNDLPKPLLVMIFYYIYQGSDEPRYDDLPPSTSRLTKNDYITTIGLYFTIVEHI